MSSTDTFTWVRRAWRSASDVAERTVASDLRAMRGIEMFHVVDGSAPLSGPGNFYLIHDPWDDWFQFATLYTLHYVDSELKRHEIGQLKIGQVGLLPASAKAEARDGHRTPSIPSTFDELPKTHFSLPQDAGFYEVLTELGIREETLAALHDIARFKEYLRLALPQEVTKISLLRYVPLQTVRSQFARLATGGARLTAYDFSFQPGGPRSNSPRLSFSVRPGSTPPTNIQVLIGRNGVGKSTLLDGLAQALVRQAAKRVDDTSSTTESSDGGWSNLSNLVVVAFSAFDQFEPLPERRDRTEGLTYHYVGLKKKGVKKDEPSALKDHSALTGELTRSMKACLVGEKRHRWLRALRLLETDPIFDEAGLSAMVSADGDDVVEGIGRRFKRLSSGHAIVLLTLTKLVDTVGEGTLVLIDEPEAHLHPPLLSAFVRALSDLLQNRNGLAIVATHSPVVLQEVPSSCVWKLRRTGKVMMADRPTIETFGENVGTLTDEIFGLEVTSTGYHSILQDLAEEDGASFESVLDELGGQLGAEGQAMLMGMLLDETMQGQTGSGF